MTEKISMSEYHSRWNKANMKKLNVAYKAEFVDEFKAACKTLGVKQSAVIREAMENAIEKAKAME